MNYDLTCAHGPLAISFEFMSVDEAIASAQVNITLSYLTSTEKFDWGIYEVWVPYRSLEQFEAALGTTEKATLLSARGQRLMSIAEDSDASRIEVGSTLETGTTQPEASVLQAATGPGLKRSLERAFREYAKWW